MHTQKGFNNLELAVKLTCVPNFVIFLLLQHTFLSTVIKFIVPTYSTLPYRFIDYTNRVYTRMKI